MEREILKLSVVVEADPAAVIRILQHFQARNLVPHRVAVQSIGAEYLQISIEVAGLTREVARRVAEKMSSAPTTLAAVLTED